MLVQEVCRNRRLCFEINESDPDKFVDIVATLEPTFGGINLKDPECFYIERALRSA